MQRRHLHEDIPLGPKEASAEARFASREEVRKLGLAVQLDDGSLVSFARRIAQSSHIWAAGCEPHAGHGTQLKDTRNIYLVLGSDWQRISSGCLLK